VMPSVDRDKTHLNQCFQGGDVFCPLKVFGLIFGLFTPEFPCISGC
jgi:hypothetical protein